MKILKKIHILAAAALMGLGTTSCSDYLDVSKELAATMDKNDVFSTPSYFKRWYSDLYATLPLYSESGFNVNGTWNANVWATYSGELVCAHPNVLRFGQNTFTANSTEHNRWWNCYERIRQAMILLDRAPESMGNANDNSDAKISASDMRRYKADAVFLMAYNYFQLFECYGPTPIITEIADPENPNIDYGRASVDEMVNYIDGLLESLLTGEYAGVLPETIKTGTGDDYDHDNSKYNLNEIVRPTKAAVLALRARLAVYAASPLFNGGYTEATQLVDKDGKQLFPAYDANKWKIAKQRLEELLSFAESKGMHLYKAKPDSEGNVDPNKSIYELFQYYNDEILWANGTNDYNQSLTGYKMEARTVPGGITAGMGNVGFYQNIVDLFFTSNGLGIDEDEEYREDGFVNLKNPCNETGHVDKHIFNMYQNREPRFYADVTYEGKSWHKQLSNMPDWGFFTATGGGSYRDQTMYGRGGYLLYKFNNRSLLNEGSNLKQWGRPWIYFRLADFYLYYAEVCNEINPNDPNIIKYLDAVRERAGIPTYATLAAEGKKNIVGDQDKQREAIYRERIIEMLGEGNYYFDMHRWMRAGWTQKQADGTYDIKNNDEHFIPRYGMDYTKPSVTKFKSGSANNVVEVGNDVIGKGSFYNRVVVDQFPWKKAMLLYPIPYNELQKSQLIVQNPLW